MINSTLHAPQFQSLRSTRLWLGDAEHLFIMKVRLNDNH